MKLIVEPDHGLEPVLRAVAAARKTLDLSIFRLDSEAVTKALRTAVRRGVAVRALVANRNGASVKALRRLERQLLAAGVTVCRTDNDLVRYHDKLMIADRQTLYVLGFNFTRVDLNSRSFGVATRSRRLVREAVKLFEADCTRRPYAASSPSLVVSPLNARARLAALIRRARRQLLIYDSNVNDPAMLKRLQERAQSGVDVRIIGKVGKKGSKLRVARCPGRRLHVRAIVQDARRAFVGSQGLRRLELDQRREVGIVTEDAQTIRGIVAEFEKDWAQTETAKREAKLARKRARKARR